MNDVIDQFRQAIAAAGLTPPTEIIDDGAIHRFSTDGKLSHKNGWYILHSDGIPAGNQYAQVPTRTRQKTRVRKTNYWRRSMATTWTPERRARQAELIRTWRPWAKSTGPKSPAGRLRVGRNAYKGGHWLMLRELSKMVNAECRQARGLVAAC